MPRVTAIVLGLIDALAASGLPPAEAAEVRAIQADLADRLEEGRSMTADEYARASQRVDALRRRIVSGYVGSMLGTSPCGLG